MDSYKKLDIRVQEWIFKQGWTGLREIQSLAIDPILSAQTDVLISASTAAGKTEAFFLPAISGVVGQPTGVGILYISPLKALINDQDRRLESLSDLMGIPVTPWHGDSPQSRKNKLKKSPSGIVLITPESLESLLIRDAGWVKSAFGNLTYIVIDEFHSFLGRERGHHLLSLLHRLEHLLDRLKTPIPRVALSATLGDLETVPLSLRPNHSLPCEIIKDTRSTSELKIQVKGYVQPAVIDHEKHEDAEIKICEDLFKFCRGGNHLVFANSRNRTESIAATLSDLCEERFVPNEFFPHHGSLAKELREDLEARLQNVVHSKFARISYTDAVKELEKANDKFQYKVSWGVDLQTEHERYLCEEIFKKPVFVTDYPKDIKAFYMKQNPDGKTVAATDLLVPGIGEIIGGSERESDYDKLVKRVGDFGINPDSIWWYLESRKFGTAPHAGFGLGFERRLRADQSEIPRRLQLCADNPAGYLHFTAVGRRRQDGPFGRHDLHRRRIWRQRQRG